LHSQSVVTAAIAMRVLRGVVGFMFFHLAFWLRREIAGTAWFGLAIALSGMATLGANFVGPLVRRRMKEATMILSALIAVGVSGVAAAWYGELVGGIVLAAMVNAAAAIGRLAFDSTVQSGAPDANRARAFSRFETHNQMAWVLGGLIPVVLSPSGRVGFLVVGVVGIAGAVMFIRSGGASIAFRRGRATGPEHRSH
jgi:thiol:disulfide interchange protein